MIASATIALCLLSLMDEPPLSAVSALTPHAQCQAYMGTGALYLSHSDADMESALLSRLDAGLGVQSDLRVRGLTLRLSTNWGLYTWQTAPSRPCGSRANTRCLGLGHVETPVATEKKEVYTAMLGWRGVFIGPRLHRRAVKWQDHQWPRLCGEDYDPACYLPSADGSISNGWGGIGAWQNAAVQLHLEHGPMTITAWHVVGRYRQRSLPWPTQAVRAAFRRGPWFVSGEVERGPYSQAWRVQAAFNVLRLHFGRVMYPRVERSVFGGGLSIAVGV